MSLALSFWWSGNISKNLPAESIKAGLGVGGVVFSSPLVGGATFSQMLDSEPTTLSCGCNLAFTLAGSKKERRKLAEAVSGHTQKEDLSEAFWMFLCLMFLLYTRYGHNYSLYSKVIGMDGNRRKWFKLLRMQGKSLGNRQHSRTSPVPAIVYGTH